MEELLYDTTIPLVVSVLSLFISIYSTFYYTRRSVRLSAKTRLAELIDKVYTLSQERQTLLSEKKEGDTEKMAEIQLQMKHLLFEIDEMSRFQKLSQAQNRLLAETFGKTLYEDYARKYWSRVFEDEFSVPELEAEYYRRYAQYLYEKGDFKYGEIAFEKSLSVLDNDSDSRRYINSQTYTDWATLEFVRERGNYLLNKSRGTEVPLPTFEKVHAILARVRPLLECFENYTLYWNAVANYNRVVELIEHFKQKNKNP